MKMNINDILIRPIVTEKSNDKLLSNVYTFEVHPKSTKTEVKKAVEFIFARSNAKVKKVNILKVSKKPKRMGKYEGFSKGYKKAMVFLAEGSIPIYGAEGVEKQQKDTKKKKGLKIIDTDKIMEQAAKENTK